ncbi:MAG: hypothetical protein U9P72_06215 [Campylobacterota bacterium]|nr:hypothetical protein [Campylobacterota bacterium]
MSKFFQAFFTGIFFTFILDFFLFLGIFQNYIKFYEIELYYNILFADNQNIYIYSIFSIVIGYIVIYLNKNSVTISVLGILFFLVSLTLIEPIGNSVAKMILMKENVTLKWKKYTYTGDIYYDGRKVVTFYDYKLEKFIFLDKINFK